MLTCTRLAKMTLLREPAKLAQLSKMHGAWQTKRKIMAEMILKCYKSIPFSLASHVSARTRYTIASCPTAHSLARL